MYWRRLPCAGPRLRPEVAALVVGLFTGFTLSSGGMHTLGFQVPMAPPLEGPGRGAGEHPPILRAEGWSDGAPPNWEQLKGQVVVLDVWAYW